MKTKHTKGEWYVENNKVYSNVANRTLIADLSFFQSSFEYSAETEANAKLIAAAPELLDVLEMVIADVEFNGEILKSTISKAKQTIKKATE